MRSSGLERSQRCLPRPALWLCIVGSLLAASAATPEPAAPKLYTFDVVASFPHDRGAFTQGLGFSQGQLYEGTGLRRRSSLRRVELASGKVLAQAKLPDRYFGEGIAILGERIYQLSWKQRTGFVYERESLQEVARFHYDHEGWGLTTDGQQLIASDGTPTLRFIDPDGFREVRRVRVRDRGRPVHRLNELEYIEGEIFANVWRSDRILRIDPGSGAVTGSIDLSALRKSAGEPRAHVLNGIAYDEAQGRIYVTGKRWSQLFQISLRPLAD